MSEIKELKCNTCGETFEFTQGEEQFLREKFGSSFAPPKHCRSCRQRRKDEQKRGQQRVRY